MKNEFKNTWEIILKTKKFQTDIRDAAPMYLESFPLSDEVVWYEAHLFRCEVQHAMLCAPYTPKLRYNDLERKEWGWRKEGRVSEREEREGERERGKMREEERECERVWECVREADLAFVE